MKYQVGDDIMVLHSKEEGKVIEIINEKMVLIEIRGVRFPAYMDQIDFPYFHRFKKNKIVAPVKPEKKHIDQIPVEKHSQKSSVKVEDGVWLSIIPKFTFDEYDDEVVELVKIYLVNKTDLAYKFMYAQQYKGLDNFSISSELLPHHDFYLHDINFADFTDNPSFHLEFSLNPAEKKKAAFFKTMLKLKARQIFKKIEDLKVKNQPVLSYNLFTKYPDKTDEEKSFEVSAPLQKHTSYTAQAHKKYTEPARSIIDLHIEKLVDDFSGMSNFEILTLQLKEFEKWFAIAYANRLSNFFVIHGIGTGKLRGEIHEILKVKHEVDHFYNNYDPRFGYGATEIFFKYN